MSRAQGDRRARSNGCGVANVVHLVAIPHAVAGVPFAARSRYAGPSGLAQGRPPRRGNGMRPTANVAGRRQYGVLVLAGITEAAGKSRITRR